MRKIYKSLVYLSIWLLLLMIYVLTRTLWDNRVELKIIYILLSCLVYFISYHDIANSSDEIIMNNEPELYKMERKRLGEAPLIRPMFITQKLLIHYKDYNNVKDCIINVFIFDIMFVCIGISIPVVAML